MTKQGRKPIHLEMIGCKTNRQRIWEAVRAEQGDFTWHSVAKRARVEPNTTRLYLRLLLRAGYLSAPENGGYRLVNDCGAEAPAVGADGRSRQVGLGTEAMWRTLRILGEVSSVELADQASVAVKTTRRTAYTYLNWLRRAGYVSEVAPAKGGHHGHCARFRLVPGKYTGPRPPMIQKGGAVYDPNLGEVVYRHVAETEGEPA